MVNTTNLTLETGKSYHLSYRVDPNETTDKTVYWSSDDGNIATVTSDAWITARNLGESTITVRTINQMQTTIKVRVVETSPTPTATPTPIPTDIPTPTLPLVSYPTKIDLSLSRLILPLGESKQVSVLFQPQNVSHKSMTWSMDDATVATVTADGLVTAKKTGTTTLNITTANNLSDTATVIVTSSADSFAQTTPVPPSPTQEPTPMLVPTLEQRLWTFEYDVNNTKPFIKCSTYTASDRARLESLLTQAVNAVGRGTRAGVVEAARFLSGGMKYKVSYRGTSKVDSTLGRYYKLGLNIANSKGWGCNVSGYTQGMDCTNFVYWAVKNGGLSSGSVGIHSGAVPLAQNVNKVRVGDFLLTLSDGSVSWTYAHTTIVIGVDSNFIYIAEQTSWGTRVSKVSKSNPPAKKSEHGMVSFGNYPSEGRVTDMWNE